MDNVVNLIKEKPIVVPRLLLSNYHNYLFFYIYIFINFY